MLSKSIANVHACFVRRCPWGQLLAKQACILTCLLTSRFVVLLPTFISVFGGAPLDKILIKGSFEKVRPWPLCMLPDATPSSEKLIFLSARDPINHKGHCFYRLIGCASKFMNSGGMDLPKIQFYNPLVSSLRPTQKHPNSTSLKLSSMYRKVVDYCVNPQGAYRPWVSKLHPAGAYNQWKVHPRAIGTRTWMKKRTFS